MERKKKCPVCKTMLTEAEYDKALGLWSEKKEHIKHLEGEQKKLKALERSNKKKIATERKQMKDREKLLKQDAKEREDELIKQNAKIARESKQALTKHSKLTDKKLKDQKIKIEKKFDRTMKSEIKKGVTAGVVKQKKEFKKQQADMKKTKNKMLSLETSLRVSSKKFQQATEEIKKLKEQIEKGITPQIEGLLEEGKLLAKLKALFPQDKFKHTGKGGDILQFIIEQGKEIGKIVYECKKVKMYNKKYIEQTKEARRFRQADYGVLVTNAFPSKKQYYFVEKTVFVISPISLEPVTFTLRDSLVKMALLKMSNRAKELAVQRVYDYLSGKDYNNKMNDVANQLMELGRDLKVEINSHKKTWEKRYHIYRTLFGDIGAIEYSLKELVQNRIENKTKLVLTKKTEFIEIEGLQKK